MPLLAQVQGTFNCKLVYGKPCKGKGDTGIECEPLVNVYALKAIPAGQELLLDYGTDYFEGEY